MTMKKSKAHFYDTEVQKVIKMDDIYKIEKILKTRRRGRVKEYLVKWKGYPDKFNSWVNEKRHVRKYIRIELEPFLVKNGSAFC